MLDLVIAGGHVVTPNGAGLFDVGISGERIAAVTQPGALPREGVPVLDAAGLIVVPGGVEPHTHLAHPIQMSPDEVVSTLGPEEDTVGMACGGTTTHIDFAFVRPGADPQEALNRRLERWKGRSHVDYSFHICFTGQIPIRTFDAVPDLVQAGFPSFKVFTTDILPPHPKRHQARLDFGRIQLLMEKARGAGGMLVVHAEDHDIVQFNYEKFREEGRLDGTNLHLVHNKLSELLSFRRVVALANAMETAVYFVHTSASEGVDTVREARAGGQPVYAETLHQYACFSAEDYRKPRGFCYHTYPSLKFPEDNRALWDGLVRGGVSTAATDEFPTSLELKLRGRTIEDVTGGNVGAEARLGIVYSEGVGKRGMSLERFVDVTSANAARIFGMFPRKGAIAPGSDADFALIDPTITRPLTRDDFHVSDYSPWEGWPISGWPVITVLRGKVIADHGRLVGGLADGQLIPRRVGGDVLGRPVC